jgi:hypothetical protein
LTSTDCRVPLVPKFSVSSVDGSTLPLPETVVWITPAVACTVSVEVRAELDGGPISVIARAISAAAAAASRTSGNGVVRLSRRPYIVNRL